METYQLLIFENRYGRVRNITLRKSSLILAMLLGGCLIALTVLGLMGLTKGLSLRQDLLARQENLDRIAREQERALMDLMFRCNSLARELERAEQDNQILTLLLGPETDLEAPEAELTASMGGSAEQRTLPPVQLHQTIAPPVRKINNFLSILQARAWRAELEQQHLLVAAQENDAARRMRTEAIRGWEQRTSSMLALARTQLGKPYCWGGNKPETGFDCSGFVQWVFAKHGIRLPRETTAQLKVGLPVEKWNLRPGDLVFFNRPDAEAEGKHVGIYMGGGKFIHSTHTGDVIRIARLDSEKSARRYLEARRLIPVPDELPLVSFRP